MPSHTEWISGTRFEVARELDLPYVLNVHDDLEYNIGQRSYYDAAVEGLGIVWREAEQRFVISKAMGHAYTQRFGTAPFEVVTGRPGR